MPLVVNLRHLEADNIRLEGKLPARELDIDPLDTVIQVAQPLEYDLEVQKLEDGWKSAGLQSLPPSGLDPAAQIDHIFLSPGTRVLDANYYAPGPSDHPMLVVTVGN